MPFLAPGPRVPDPYLAAVALLGTLPALTRSARLKLKITPKVQAKQIGISLTTLQRFEAGSDPQQSTVLAVLRWLSKGHP